MSNTITILNSQEDVEKCIELFIEHTTSDYISHSEIICGRAIDQDIWAPELSQRLRDRLKLSLDNRSVIVALLKNKRSELIGFCIIAIESTQHTRHRRIAWIEDIVIHSDYRGKKLGTKLIIWATDFLTSNNVKKVFIESGLRNKNAHRFFKNKGFIQTSIVMMKQL